MSDKNGSIKEEVVEGSFTLLHKIIDKWWIFAIGIVIYLMYIGKLDTSTVDFVVERFVKLATAIKGLF
jgi:hypothetical protein